MPTTFELGDSIPAETAHAVSVSLPTWSANVGYEEGQDWVVKRMTTGYPRFFIHRSIQAFAADIVAKHVSTKAKQPGDITAMLFPTPTIASRCVDFIRSRAPVDVCSNLQVINLVLDMSNPEARALEPLCPSISAVIMPQDGFPFAKQYWQHSGDGVSSRRAEFCHGLFKDGLLRPDTELRNADASASAKPCRGPKRYQRQASLDAGGNQQPNVHGNVNGTTGETVMIQETSRFLEERFGRNLDLSFVQPAKSAIKRRIAGALRSADHDLGGSHSLSEKQMSSNTRGIANLREEDIYLFPCGMNAIFHAHRALYSIRTPPGSTPLKSVNFGFPYVDTLKILEKFNPSGALFYGRASESDLDDLETRLEAGERYLALFCEFPGNPLLTCPSLVRIRELADKYEFAVVVDETIGTFANVNVLQFADIVVSSLTKIFSGDCNVMGGGAILNPNSRYYSALKAFVQKEFEDTYWPEDVIFMERNSRDFVARIDRVNANAEAICRVFKGHPLVKTLYYPKYNDSRANYEAVKLPQGGYGGLVSVVFKEKKQAVAFYDAIETAKGPSLGTNFTLTSPYVLLAHYQELDWAEQYGVDRDLIRISVGLEETDELVHVFTRALKVAEAQS
ncbi:pyridoxal phosphate-dependent transferase [Pseudoneurospora amorphoporcata]|uniref:cystathionine gamma-synthase n=1 Tax=Pseudoneurospora amorphoporcata TaxID=241081 RepID=A0AAN6NQX4_9PEZI|nr:pyridoxal phosphate-dependent transferase [Pseudoneurospora amorphoporcata]